MTKLLLISRLLTRLSLHHQLIYIK